MRVFLAAVLLLCSSLSVADVLIRKPSDYQLEPIGRRVMAVKQGLQQMESIMNGAARKTVVRNIEFKQCGEENAFFNHATKNIIMCYEYIRMLQRRIGEETEGQAREQFLAMVQVIFHEYGHAVSAGKMGALIMANPEDSADAVSAVIMRKSGIGTDFVAAVIGGWRGALFRDINRIGIKDVHDYDTKRRANLICWTAGGDVGIMREAVRKLYITQQRAAQCSMEALEVERRFDSFMAIGTL